MTTEGAIVLALVLLFGFLAGMVTALIVVVRGIALGVRQGRRSPAKRLGAASLLAGGAAIGMYAWGMAHVGLAVLDAEDGGTDSSPPRPCRAVGDGTAARVDDYRVGLVPLRFECHLVDGGSYATSSVPGYVNPAAGILGLAGVVCAVLSAAAADRSSRKSPALPPRRGGA